MMQTHTRRFPRRNTVEGLIVMRKREHAEQLRKLWRSVLPVLIVGAVLLVGYLLGVTAK